MLLLQTICYDYSTQIVSNILNYNIFMLFLLKHLITSKFAFIYKNNKLEWQKMNNVNFVNGSYIYD